MGGILFKTGIQLEKNNDNGRNGLFEKFSYKVGEKRLACS